MNEKDKIIISNELSSSWEDKISVKITSLMLWIVVTIALILVFVVIGNLEENISNDTELHVDIVATKLVKVLQTLPLFSEEIITHEINKINNFGLYPYIEVGIENNNIKFGEIRENNIPEKRQYFFKYNNKNATILPLNLIINKVPVKQIVIKKRNEIIVAAFIITLIFSGILMSISHIVIHKPFQEIINATKEISEGNFNLRLNSSRKDEFGQLTVFFNDMLSEIAKDREEIEGNQQVLSEKNEQLKKYGEELELRVAERTKDLAIARDDALAANKTKSSFLANMSHEIRTPLTAIIGFSENIQKEHEIDEESQKLISIIIRNGKHLLTVINDILDLSKIEADKLEIEILKVSPAQLIDDIKSTIGGYIIDKNLELSITPLFPLPKYIQTDPTRLRQILLNLCSNATKFTSKGKISITLGFSVIDNTIHFKVSDTGVGIAKDKLINLFQPFIQADSSTTRKYGGTGLGLYISQKIALNLNGIVHAESTVGIGSTFTLFLQVDKHVMNDMIYNMCEYHAHIEQITHNGQLLEGECTNQNQNQTTLINKYRGNILIAEDNKDNQLLLTHILKKSGVHFTFANNGKEAVEKAISETYDLIFMDIQMPVMDGIEATQWLRKLEYEKPIVALTADILKENIEDYIKQGCDNCLSKPIDYVKLENIFKTYLEIQLTETSQNNTENQPIKQVKKAKKKTKQHIKGNVLYAEDNLDNQNLVTLILKRTNINLTIVENGKFAVETAISGNFDLILMDMQMPIMGGAEATKLLVQSGYTKPIIALTANVMEQDIKKYNEVGCVDYIPKPVDREKFYAILEHYLSAENKQQENSEEDLLTSQNNFSTEEKSNDLFSETKLNDNDVLFNDSNEDEDDLEYQNLVKMFVSRLPSILDDINLDFQKKNWGSLKQHAHTLKGTSANFGFMDISQVAAKLQSGSENDQRDETSLAHCHNQLKEMITHHLNSLK